jgi:hypothetical protein
VPVVYFIAQTLPDLHNSCNLRRNHITSKPATTIFVPPLVSLFLIYTEKYVIQLASMEWVLAIYEY